MTSNPASVGPAPDGVLPCPFWGTVCHNVAWPRLTAAGLPVAIIECFTDGCYARIEASTPSAAIAAWNTRAPHPDREAEPTGGVVGAAEREVGRAVYERIEALMKGGANPELAYLAELAESVEEYGSYSGPTVPLALGHPVAWKFNVLNTIAGTDEDRLSFETPTCKTGERIRSVQALSVSPPVVEGSSAEGADTQPGSADDWAELEALAKAAMKRAPGLWGSDIEKSEGSYGSGDDDRTGFMVPYMETEHGKRLFDAHYCDVAEIHEDYDSDEHGSHLYAWDEASREIFNFLSAAQPSTILKLIEAARQQASVSPGEQGEG